MVVMPIHRRVRHLTAWLVIVAATLLPLSVSAQTKITLRSNKYSPADDVKLGRQAAAEAEQQMPISRDAEATAYVEGVGRRLVAAIPPEFQRPEFQYYFKIVDASDINAFALPGGPMYINRGMIEAARTEGEMAGVMAHELSHVALRHGTAQATKAQKYQYAGIAGAVLGSIIGGGIGSVVGQGSQVALGTYFLKFSREYETEADILGAQMMARAGYDPLDLANMFKTIAQQSGGSRTPQFLSTHPDPGNREARIRQEARSLRVTNPVQDTGEFRQLQARLRGGQRAPSMEEITRSGQRYPQDRRGGQYPQNSPVGGRVIPPSSRFRTYTEGNLFRLSVPDNWRELAGGNSVTFAPEGAYGNVRGSDVFTHGIEIGVFRHETHPLQVATDEFLNALKQGNPNMRGQGGYQRGTIAGRQSLATTLSNISEVTGSPEVVAIYTTQLRDGGLFYVIAVAPQGEYRNYQGVFSNVLRSIQISD